jgi:ABC-type Fe3+-citrate transport system substrate-binding protein
MVKRILGMKVVVLTLVLIGDCSVYASEQKYKSVTITDIDGKSYTVTNLLAKYSAVGSVLG